MKKFSLRTALVAGLATAFLAGLPQAAADIPTNPDERWLFAHANGVLFSDFPWGMCILDHGTCPYPWEVDGNFIGPPCIFEDDPTFVFVSCTGHFLHLWFNWHLPGMATLDYNDIVVSSLAQNDLLHLGDFFGNVALSCTLEPEPSGPECATNFDGDVILSEKWDCYLHYQVGPAEDCPNDGP